MAENFDEADAEFLAGMEDFTDIPESGSTNILEQGGGRGISKKASGGTGIPLGGPGASGDIVTPRRKVAARPKPWAAKGDYGSIYSRASGSAMPSMDFSQTPPPKDFSEPVVKKAGPFQQTTPDEGNSPSPSTNQGFVGKVKPAKPLAARDEEEPLEMEPKEIGSRSPAATGEGSLVQAKVSTWTEKMAKLQVIGQKEGTALMSFAEFKRASGGNSEAYTKYLQMRCYACADQVEGGVMCHECYAAVHVPKETTVDIKKQAAQNPLVPAKKSKTEKFDWDKNRSAEPANGHHSTKGTGEKEYLLHDADHYAEQNAAITGDEVGNTQEFTLGRGKEKKVKPDEKTLERYAEKNADQTAAINKEVPVKKPQLLTRAPGNAGEFNPAKKSMTEERQVGGEGGKEQDYVTEYNFKGAEMVKKDYPYQLMKGQGQESDMSTLPRFGGAVTTTAVTKGLPFMSSSSGVPIHANNRTLADDLASMPQPSPFRIGDKVASSAFVGKGEVSEIVQDEEGNYAGAVIETATGYITVAAKHLKAADVQDVIPGEVVEPEGMPDKKMVVQKDDATQGVTVKAKEGFGDQRARLVDKTKLVAPVVAARYKVASKPYIADMLHGKVGEWKEIKGKGCLVIAGVGSFAFRPEDLIPE